VDFASVLFCRYNYHRHEPPPQQPSSGDWFGSSERILATSIASMSNPIGKNPKL
jgi:hypothetical protein